MAAKILFLCGSLNQTTMMHQISSQLGEFDCFFSPFYADGWMGAAASAGLLDFCILGGRHRRATEAYLQDQRLPVDEGGRRHRYDLVVTGTDLIVQRNVRATRLVLVQEGMLEAEDWVYHLMRTLRLPRFLANTAATGLSHAYDVFCVASPGYREVFACKGVQLDKMVVTGIPNYDDAARYLQNDFPLRGYVLVLTSSIRETMKWDDRDRFLRQAREIAAGRPVIFKLHPNENVRRATYEIRRYFPQAPIYEQGNAHNMIANCDVLVAQNSSAIYTAVALGKEVHSYLDERELKRLLPLQNGGRSHERIAEVCRRVISLPLAELRSKRKRKLRRLLDAIEAVSLAG